MGKTIETIDYLMQEYKDGVEIIPAKQFYEDTGIHSCFVYRLRNNGTIIILIKTGYKNGHPYKESFLKLNEDRIPLLMKYMEE